MQPYNLITRPGLPAISRRRFIRNTVGMVSALGVANLLGAGEPGTKPAAKKVVVGAHPWVYAAKRSGFDINPILPAIFADLEYAGFEGLEMMHLTLRSKEACERIVELSRQHHLSIIGASFAGAMWDRAQHQAVMDDAELIIPRLARLGGRTLGTSVGPAPKRKTEQQLDDQAELLRRLISLCERHGITLNLHNHTYEIADGLHDLKGTMSRIPTVKLGPDLGWLVRGRVNPVQFIRQYGKQIVFLHLRDQTPDGKWSEALGEGNIDFAAIAGALKEAGFQGDAVVELAHERNFQATRALRESFKLSRACVRARLGW